MTWVNPTTVAPFDTLSASRWNQDVVANTEALFVGYRFAGALNITTGTTFVKATYPYLRAIRVIVVGGGGAGGGRSGSDGGPGGGGGGGYAELFYTGIASMDASVTVTVGAGGAASTGSGGTGGTSSFGGPGDAWYVIADGGIGGGNTGGGGAGGGAGGAAGALLIGGAAANDGSDNVTVGSFYISGAGGASRIGGNGKGRITNSSGPGDGGKQYGGGGGAGAQGIVIVELYA
jgi:hypothetical protein